MFYIVLFTKLICPTQVIAFFKYMYVISANKCSVRVYMWSAANFQSDYWYLRVTMIISIHAPYVGCDSASFEILGVYKEVFKSTHPYRVRLVTYYCP